MTSKNGFVSTEQDARAAHWRMDMGLAFVSSAVLVLEILQIRIFSYSLDPFTIHLAVGVCLLGLGASATVLALLPQRSVERARPFAAAFAVVGALTIPACHAVFAAWAPEVYAPTALGIVVLVVLAVPYFCFGMTIATLLVTRSSGVGRAYAFNLAGSGVGCVLIFPLLNALGAEAAIGVVAWMALAAAFMIHVPRQAIWRGAAVAGGLVLVISQIFASSLYLFPPDPEGQSTWMMKRAEQYIASRYPYGGPEVTMERHYSRWTDTARVEVWEVVSNLEGLQSRPVNTRIVLQDSAAGSVMFGVGEDTNQARVIFEDTVYGAGYVPAVTSDVLVIGLGGGPDILTALHHGASRVVGVDISGANIDIARGPFKEFLGDPYGRPEVTALRIDGRTYLRSSSDLFDLVVMTGVDTKTLYSAGSLTLSENYLYTLEAFQEMIRRLKPGGRLAITQYYDAVAWRLGATALEALKLDGAEDPTRHIFSVRQGLWKTLIVKRTPLTDEEVTRLSNWVHRHAGRAPDVNVIDLLLSEIPLARPLEILYSPPPRLMATVPFYEAVAQGRVDSFLENAVDDLYPVTDDRPYVFFKTRPERAFIEMPQMLRRLLKLAAQLALASALLILFPLFLLRRRGLRRARTTRSLIYFVCLGVGFMLVEIGLFHRFVLLLGHHSYSVTVVLFGLLGGASIGSALSSRFATARRMLASAPIAALIGVIVIYAFALDAVFSAAAQLPFAARIILALLTLLPLGIALGYPFPRGLQAVRTGSGPLAAWAIGVNGFASVLGAVLAVPIVLVTGMKVLLLGGAVLYAIAMLTMPVAGFSRSLPGLIAQPETSASR